MNRLLGKLPYRAVLVSLGLVLALLAPTASAFTVPDKMAWWYDARFGLFIHFGSYSYLGHGEWAFSNEGWSKSSYQTQVSANFNPTNFDANAIAAYAKAAGMKYVVITAKHHEGFSMWDTSVPSFIDVPGTTLYDLYHYTVFKRDVLAELKAACAAQGIKFCLYYSILDWNHPSQTISKNGPVFSTMSSLAARSAYIADMKQELSDLITKYDPDGLWFDGDWCGNPAPATLADWWTVPDGQDLYNYLVGLKPTLIVNERVKRDFGLGDYAVAEGGVPAASLSRLWETCTSMNSAWGYDSSQENTYKTPTSLIQELVRVVSRDGNYLLNIGPKGDGSVTPGAVTIFNALAAWMSIYAESVQGTTASPYSSEPSWGYLTKKSGKLYAHVYTWPTTGKLTLSPLKNTVSRAYLLANPATSLSFTSDSSGIVVTVPATAPDSSDSVIVIEVSGTPTAVAGRITSGGTATASAQNLPNEGVLSAFDGSSATKWFTNTAATTGWLQYQFPNGWGWTALQYQITSANDTPTRDPMNWQLLGSNDGTTWNLLDSQSGQTFSNRFVTNTYSVATPGNYRFYHLNITATNGSTYGVQLAEFALIPNAADFNDTTAPTLSVPASMTVPATSQSGAVVSFSPTATDAVNGNPSVVCSPASGLLFPIGATFVQCSTSDFAGNGANAGFYVNVVDPSKSPPVAPANLNATPGSGQVALAWSVVSNAASYKLYRAPLVNGAYTLCYTGTAASDTDSGLAGGSAFYYRVSALNAYGESTPSTAILSGPVGLPPTWVDQDVGTVSIAGSTSVSGGVFTVAGAGGDIWNASDAFHFAYGPWTGDGALVARIVGMTNTDPWAKAGVMFRESTAANSKQCMAMMTPTTSNGMAFQGRTATGNFNSASAGHVPPYWVKLIRRGDTFSAFSSADGLDWQTQGSAVQNVMAASLYAGLAVTSHNTSALCTAQFDQVAFFAPPVVTVPADIVVPATSPSGAPVSFSCSAQSNVNGTLVPTALPASGSVFPIGRTTVQCSATDSAGLTATVSFAVTVSGAPASPAGLAAAAGDAKVNLSWNASAGATSYLVARAPGGSGNFSTVVSGVTGVNYQDSTVVNGNSYDYVVYGINAAGTGSASAVVSAVPIGAAQMVAPQIALSGGSAKLSLQTSVLGRTYQLQRSYTLAAGTWTNVGSAQSGGGPLNFSDTPDPGQARVFYRLLIGP